MHRKDILETAISLTCGDRNESYGDPEVNLACAMELKRVFDHYNKGEGGDAHRESVHMTLTKIARIATGKYKPDNYVDGSAYIAIAGQVHCAAVKAELQEELTSSLRTQRCGNCKFYSPTSHTCVHEEILSWSQSNLREYDDGTNCLYFSPRV